MSLANKTACAAFARVRDELVKGWMKEGLGTIALEVRGEREAPRGVVTSAYTDDSFVNYGAQGDDSPYRSATYYIDIRTLVAPGRKVERLRFR